MRVLMIGFGALGQKLGLRLAQLGHQVTGLKRTPIALDNIQCLTADITDLRSLQHLPANYDQVVCMLSAGSRDPDAYRAIYDVGVRNVQQWLANQHSHPHWLFVSSTSVYGQQGGEWVDEQSATEPASKTAQYLLVGEQHVLAADPSNTVVRFSGIYGGDRRWLIRRVQQGVPVPFDPPAYTNRIHQNDCVEVLTFLMEQRLAGQVLDSIYLASDHDPAPQWEVHQWLAEQMGCPSPEPLNGEPGVKQNKRCRNQRLLDLGYRFIYPGFRDGYTEMLGTSTTDL